MPTFDADREVAKERLQAAYREHLGREMTDRDFENWWSGAYGWGVAGIEGLDGWIRGIETEGARLKAENQPVPPPITPPPDDSTGDPDPRGSDSYEGEETDAPGGLAEPPSGPEPTGAGPELTRGDRTSTAYNPKTKTRSFWEKKTTEGQTTEGDDTGVPTRTGQPPAGYDREKWNNPDHHTTKYDAAAFLQGLTKPSEIAAMVQSAAFQARFPGATFIGKDKIDFGSNLEDGVPVGVIDVLMGADQGADTSGGLYWGADEGDDTTGSAFLPEQPGAGPGQTGAGQPGAGPGQTGGWTPDTWAAALLNAQGRSPLFNPPATPGPPSMGGGTGPGGGTMGNMITPYNPLATYNPVPYTPAPSFAQNPFAAAAPFTGPTAEQLTADPGYQFRLRQGQEALERSGAARGVTNTGGTLKDILDYGQNAASQEYQNVFGRQRDIYDLNERNRFDAYQANFKNAMDAYNLNERNRYQGYTTNELARWEENQEAEARRSGAYATNLGGYERQQQYGLRAQGQGFDQAYRNWQEQFNQGRMNAQDTYNRMYGLGTS